MEPPRKPKTVMEINTKERRLKPGQDPVYIDPTNDYGFKIMYGVPGCEQAMMELLSQIIPSKEIVSVEFLPTEQLPLDEKAKRTICDVKCMDQNGDIFLVEMQKRPYDGYGNRLLVYSGHSIPRLLERGHTYSDIKTLYVISILDYMLEVPGDSPEYQKKSLRSAQFMMTDSRKVWSDKLNFLFLSLRCRDRNSKEWLERWAWYMKDIATATEPPVFDKDDDPHFADMYRRADPRNIEATLLENYDKMVRDEIQIQAEKDYAVRKATEAALAKGEAKGKAEGKSEVVKAMLAAGVSAEVISNALGVSVDEIEHYM